MQIPILIEPIDGGRFRARMGEPFALSAEGATEKEATELLTVQVEERLRSGVRYSVIEVGNGLPPCGQTPLHFEPLPDDDWFFKSMRETIAENRRREEAET